MGEEGVSFLRTLSGYIPQNVTLYEFLEDQYEIYTGDLMRNLFYTSAGINLVLLISSPTQALQRWYRRRSSDTDPPAPYLIGFSMTLLWLMYSLLREDGKMIALQMYATLTNVIFICALWYFRTRKRLLNRFLFVIGSLFFILYNYVQLLPRDEATDLIGTINSSMQFLAALSGIYCVRLAMVRKVVDFASFWPVCQALICGMHGFVYGIINEDFYVSVSAGLFFLLDFTLFLLFFVYPPPKEVKLKEVNIIPLYKKIEHILESYKQAEQGGMLRQMHIPFVPTNVDYNGYRPAKNGLRKAYVNHNNNIYYV